MKYAVYWRRKGAIKDFEKLICKNEEELVATIQNLQINSQEMREIETRIFPFFEENQLVFNRRTLQTRVVKEVHAMQGYVKVYNFDNPYDAESQKNNIMPSIPEDWNIYDCIPFDKDRAIRKYHFKLGTSMGRLPIDPRDEVKEMFE